MIGADLLRYKKDQKYCVFDIETEGLNLLRSKPWQIAYMVYCNGNVEESRVRYPFWKDLSISKEAAEVTRFDKKSYLQNAEPPDKVLNDFEQIILDPSIMVVGHNILGFDLYIWQSWRRLNGLKTDWSVLDRSIDTFALARAYRHQHLPDKSNLIAWQYRMISIRGSRAKGMGCSLGSIAKEFNIPYDERQAHDAMYDIGVNKQVFNQLIWNIEI